MTIRSDRLKTQATHLVDRDIDESIEFNCLHIVLTSRVTLVFTVAMLQRELGSTDTSQVPFAVAVSLLSPFLVMTIHRLALVVIFFDTTKGVSQGESSERRLRFRRRTGAECLGEIAGMDAGTRDP